MPRRPRPQPHRFSWPLTPQQVQDIDETFQILFDDLRNGAIDFSNITGQVVLTTQVTGVLPIANGGTNSGNALSGSTIIISNGASIVQGPAGTTTTVLHGNASGAPTYGKVVLTTDVSGTLPVGNGGTGTGTAFTAGSVIFAGPSGVFAQDNANFFWDDTNNRLGLGTASPLATLQVKGTASKEIQIGTTAGIYTTSTYFTDLNTLGAVINLARPSDGLFTHSVFTYDTSGGDNNLGIAARSDIRFEAGGAGVNFMVFTQNAKLGIRVVPSGWFHANANGYRAGWILRDGATDRAHFYFGDGTNGTTSNDLYLDEINSTIHFRTNASGNGETLILDTSNNVGMSTSSFGTSAAKVFAIANGTAPSTSPTDEFQLYSADQAAGNAAPHFRTENGSIVKLYKTGTYTPTNVTTDRSYDADATSLDELADVVGTLIADLQLTGLLG